MNILFVFSRHSKDPRDSTLTKDLANEFVKHNHNVYVVTLQEKQYNCDTQFKVEHKINVLRVKSGNYFGVGYFEKFFTVLMLPWQILSAAKKYLLNTQIDLIVTHTPFVSTYRIIKPLKKLLKSKAHLLLWDIFPQNAKDLGLIKNSLIFNILKTFERKMLLSYDQIWCMSDGNVNYLRLHYPYLSNTGVERLYNSSRIEPCPRVNKHTVRLRYGYRVDDIVAVFGGNMGKPQCLSNLLILARNAQTLPKAKFIFIGNGTEKSSIMNLAKSMHLSNVVFLSSVPRVEYKEFIACMDIGLVSLDERFTVPNFPSKTTDYFSLKIPILASIDQCAANDYGKFLTDAGAGMFAVAGDHNNLFKRYKELYFDERLRLQLGDAGRVFYESELNVTNSYKKIMSKLQ